MSAYSAHSGAAKTKPSLRKRFAKALNRDKYLYLMFLGPFLYYLLFHYYPLYGVTLAFKNFTVKKGILGSPWVGMKYINQIIRDAYFWQVFRNTIVINIFNILWSFPMPVILALMLNELRSMKYKKLVQTISYIPHFLSTVVVVGMLTSLLNSEGLVNRVLGAIGLGGPYPFLTQPQYFRSVYIASGIWQGCGWGSIIYLAALSSLDMELYEAARIDGAGRWAQMVHITLPGISSTVTIMLILEMGNIMNVAFQKILLMMNGSNQVVSDVISTYVYRRGINQADFSYATGVGLFQSLVALIFVTATNAISRKVSETSLW